MCGMLMDVRERDVPRGEVGNVLNIIHLQIRSDLRHQPPVQDAQSTVRGAFQIARMRISMQFHALLQHHREVCIHSDRAKGGDVTPGTGVEFLPVDPAGSEDFAGAGRADHS